MSAVAAQLLSSDALTFDSTEAATGARAFVDNRGAMLAYVAAVLAVPTGMQPIKVDGNVVGSFDPLDKFPGAAAAIQSAQYHAKDVAGTLDFLHGWAQGNITTLVGYVIAPVTAMRDLVAAIPSGGALTPEADRQVLQQMQMARFWTEMIANSVNTIRQGIHKFLTQLGTDHDALARGPYELETVIPEMEKRVSDAAMPLIIHPVTAGIRRIYLSIGASMRDGLQLVSRAMQNALQGHEAMRGGISAFASGAETMRAKYSSAETALSRADIKTRATVLRQLDLNKAVVSWEQFRDFILKSGF